MIIIDTSNVDGMKDGAVKHGVEKGLPAVSRRQLLKLVGAGLLAGGSGFGIFGCDCSSGVPFAPRGSYRFEADTLIISLDAAEKLQPVGGAVRVRLEVPDMPAGQIIAAHIGEEDFLAFANKCTHEGRELDYMHENGMIKCCSGHSRFDLQGQVIDGKAETALQVFSSTLDANNLIIELLYWSRP